MVELTKSQRSDLLNRLDRILIDFKSLLDSDRFLFYKQEENILYYLFDQEGNKIIKKTKDLCPNFEMGFLKKGDIIEIVFQDLKSITSLKKREVLDISYDDEKIIFKYKTDNSDQENIFTMVKHKKTEDDNIIDELIERISEKYISDNYKKAYYSRENQLLYMAPKDAKQEDLEEYQYIDSIYNQLWIKRYPYKITFSEDINHKLGTNYEDSSYYLRLFNQDAFIEVVTVVTFKESYEVFSKVFVFNYFKDKNPFLVRYKYERRIENEDSHRESVSFDELPF